MDFKAAILIVRESKNLSFMVLIHKIIFGRLCYLANKIQFEKKSCSFSNLKKVSVGISIFKFSERQFLKLLKEEVCRWFPNDTCRGVPETLQKGLFQYIWKFLKKRQKTFHKIFFTFENFRERIHCSLTVCFRAEMIIYSRYPKFSMSNSLYFIAVF